MSGQAGGESRTPSAEELSERYGEWNAHEVYGVEDCQHEVTNGDTRRGYWAWVASQLEQAADEQDMEGPKP